MNKLLYFFIALAITLSCAKKTVKPQVEEKPEKTIVKQAAPNVVFCKKLFERKQKLAFINNVYRAFTFGDSSLIKPYIVQPIKLSIQNGSGSVNSFKNVSVSAPTCNNWGAFLSENLTRFGTSVCNELTASAANFKAETCISNKGVSGDSYLTYIHFKKVKGEYVLTGIGGVIF